MDVRRMRSLWLRWVLGNSIGELVGLGCTFAIGVGLFSGLANTPGAMPAILTGLLMTSSGLIEGAIVGLAQWWAMHPSFPQLPRRSWVLATILGALVAWFLGSMPMTLTSLIASGPEQAGQEPEASLMLLLAGAMGLVAGIVLALPQWQVLRRRAERAWLWLPANSVAWAVGMPIVFMGVDQAQKAASATGSITTMAFMLAVTGAAVGAIHGLVLAYLAGQSNKTASEGVNAKPLPHDDAA